MGLTCLIESVQQHVTIWSAWCCSSPSRVCPYLFGHFLILSFFHVFRFSADPALVLGAFFGPTVCSFPYGCNEHKVSMLLDLSTMPLATCAGAGGAPDSLLHRLIGNEGLLTVSDKNY